MQGQPGVWGKMTPPGQANRPESSCSAADTVRVSSMSLGSPSVLGRRPRDRPSSSAPSSSGSEGVSFSFSSLTSRSRQAPPIRLTKALRL